VSRGGTANRDDSDRQLARKLPDSGTRLTWSGGPRGMSLGHHKAPHVRYVHPHVRYIHTKRKLTHPEGGRELGGAGPPKLEHLSLPPPPSLFASFTPCGYACM